MISIQDSTIESSSSSSSFSSSLDNFSSSSIGSCQLGSINQIIFLDAKKKWTVKTGQFISLFMVYCWANKMFPFSVLSSSFFSFTAIIIQAREESERMKNKSYSCMKMMRDWKWWLCRWAKLPLNDQFFVILLTSRVWINRWIASKSHHEGKTDKFFPRSW